MEQHADPANISPHVRLEQFPLQSQDCVLSRQLLRGSVNIQFTEKISLAKHAGLAKECRLKVRPGAAVSLRGCRTDGCRGDSGGSGCRDGHGRTGLYALFRTRLRLNIRLCLALHLSLGLGLCLSLCLCLCLCRTLPLRTGEPRAGPVRYALLVGRGNCASTLVCGLVEVVARVALDPFEGIFAANDRLVNVFEKVHVQHGLAVCLPPALPFPTRHPLGDAVDDVLAVAKDQQLFLRHVGRGPEQVQDGHQFTLVVGTVRPTSCSPTGVINVPGPTGRPRITEGGTIGGSNNRHGLILPDHTDTETVIVPK
ncbi:hypothetical protein D3C73_991360 [compost metagenome]